MNTSSIKPYLIRAVYEWCTNNDFTPYISAVIDGCSDIPVELAEDGEITLNISHTATHGLLISNETICFTTRFNGVARQIEIAVGAVKAVFAKELGQGLTFIPEVVPKANKAVTNEEQGAIIQSTALDDDQDASFPEVKRSKSFLKLVK